MSRKSRHHGAKVPAKLPLGTDSIPKDAATFAHEIDHPPDQDPAAVKNFTCAELHHTFREFFDGRTSRRSERIVREASDGTLLRALREAKRPDPKLLSLLEQVSSVPDPKSAAWTLYHLLIREESRAPDHWVPASKPVKKPFPWLALISGLAGGFVLLLVATWIGTKFGWTNARSRAEKIAEIPSDAQSGPLDSLRSQVRVREMIDGLIHSDPLTGLALWRLLRDSGDGRLVAGMLAVADSSRKRSPSGLAYPWSRTEIWDSTLVALHKDRDLILLAARETGLSPRLVALPALCEHMRRAESFRDRYKHVFSRFIPTGNLSMGVTGIKPETLRKIVPWCDPKFLPLIDSVSDQTIRDRLDDDDHRWSYLYSAICLSAIQRYWRQEAGIDLFQRPEILLTVYNIGIHKCPPRRDPEAGGAIFRLAGTEYTFGSFSWEFYWSGRDLDDFPF